MDAIAVRAMLSLPGLGNRGLFEEAQIVVLIEQNKHRRL